VIDDGETRIKENPYPWNLRANVLYIESPAGVGFSFVGQTSLLTTNDFVQSQDLMTAIEQFYLKFEDFLDNDLYITGESYAGIYVPYLAWQIYNNNENAAFDDSLTAYNLKGFAVGNGATNYTIDVWPAYVTTLYKFHIIPKSLYDDWNNNNCFLSFMHALDEVRTITCDVLFEKIQLLTSDLNWYDLYRPVYDNAINNAGGALKAENRMGEAIVNGEVKKYKRGFTMAEYTPMLKDRASAHKILLGDYMSDYVNDEATREALNIPTSLPAWEECSSQLDYLPQPEASIWIYKVLRDKYKILFYSGDTDGALPTYGTRTWINSLGWGVKEKWRYWRTEGQVSGFIEQYNGLDFVTVHGVGHMAPQWKRKDVTSMISAWVHNEPIDEFP